MSEWIKCSDRMPEMGKGVIVCVDEKIVVDGIYSLYIPEEKELYESWWSAENEKRPDFSMNDVTHWQPLPEPPKS